MDEKDKLEVIQKAEKFAVTKDINSTLFPTAPNGDNPTSINDALEQEKDPDKKEQKRIKKRFRNIWNDYRSNVFDTLDAKNYAEYCEIRKQTAETEKELMLIENEKEEIKAKHWLKMHEGNLKEIGYNTESMPNRVFYSIDRFIFYLKNGFNNIPKMVWKTLIAIIGIGVIVLLVKLI
jgi:hypothetical protein